MIIPIFTANIKSLQISGLNNQESWENYKKKLKNTVQVIVRHPQKRTSDPQRAWLFGVAYKMIGDEVGMTPKEVHYSEPITKLRMDYTKAIPTPKSVSRQGMTTEEFNEYKESLQMWAAVNLELDIPDPEEVLLELL